MEDKILCVVCDHPKQSHHDFNGYVASDACFKTTRTEVKDNIFVYGTCGCTKFSTDNLDYIERLAKERNLI